MPIRTYFDIGATGAPFDVLVIPNQGAGAASARIETARRPAARSC
jgi:hypothetical protein